MFLFSKKLSGFLVLLFIFNVFVSTSHFGLKHHTFNPETGKIEHAHTHRHCDHNNRFIPNSFFPDKHENEGHDFCGILDQMLLQFLKNHTTELIFTETSLTPYLNRCAEKIYLLSDILSFAPKLSPPGTV